MNVSILSVKCSTRSRLTFSAPYVSSASRAATVSKPRSNAAHARPRDEIRKQIIQTSEKFQSGAEIYGHPASSQLQSVWLLT